jgi:hypothetical protein
MSPMTFQFINNNVKTSDHARSLLFYDLNQCVKENAEQYCAHGNPLKNEQLNMNGCSYIAQTNNTQIKSQ